MDIKKMLFELLEARGLPGQEFDAGKVAAKYLEKYADVSTDDMGNLTAVSGNREAPFSLLLDAHLDKIGIIVTSVTDKGFVRFDKTGGIDLRVLPGHEVTVYGKQPLFGIVSCMPPHLMSDSDTKKLQDFDSLAIDVGLSPEKAKELIRPGDRIELKGKPQNLCDDIVASAGLDNRASVAALIYALYLLKDKPIGIKLTVLLSAQEETGERGAMTAAFKSDANEAISVDVGFGYSPDCKKEKCGQLAKGVMIGFAPVLSLSMTERLMELAKDNKIDYQYDIMGDTTGTNADVISVSKSGISTALLSIPLKYMHTTVETVCIKDIVSTAELIAQYVLDRSKTVGKA